MPLKTSEAIDRFIVNRQSRKLSPQTIQFYEGHLRRGAESFPELPETPEPLKAYLGKLAGAPETVHGAYRCLKALYRFLRRRYGLTNPVELIEPPRRPRKRMPTLEPLQMMRMICLAGKPRDRALLLVLADTGARVGEIAGLQWRDIHDDTISVTGKTGEREVPISDETRRLLLSLRAKGDYVFTNYRGEPISRQGIYLIVSACMEKTGITGPKLGPHRLRHAFGKGYLVNGGDVRSLQQILGHSSIATTEHYAELTLTDVIDKHHKFTPLRAIHAAAQGSFDTALAVKEAEQIVAQSRKES
jgi:integrase/recombinase XerD